MGKVAIVGVMAAILMALVIGSSARAAGAAPRESDNRVVCVAYGGGGEASTSLRTTPRKCTFVHRGQEPFGANTVDMTGLRWKSWGTRRARAEGKQLVNMSGPVAARVTLKRPRRGCGGRTVFTVAVFSAADSDSDYRSRLPLDACP